MIKDYLLIGLPIVLVVLFICLKLLGYITWSWWWVVSPLWLPSAILALITILFGFWFIFKVVINLMIQNE